MTTLFPAFVVGVCLTSIILQLASRLPWLARPSADRLHVVPTPIWGGVAVFFSFMLVASIRGLFNSRQAVALAVAAGCMFFLGFLDDMWNLPPRWKLLGQLFCSLTPILFLSSHQLTGNRAMNVLLGLFWMIGITNAFNLLDNINGLAGGTAVLVSGFQALLFLDKGEPLRALLSLSFAAAVMGFLVFNFPKGRIFKPVLCGTAAALARKDIKVINALTGLGFLVTSKSLKAKFLRPFIWALLGFLLRQSNQHVLLQNEEDKLFLTSYLGARAEHITLIRGSGVNANIFRSTPEPPGIPVVLLASRMLWIKGIREFVEAAKLLRDRGVVGRFVLVGDSDFANPSSVPRQQLIEWQTSGALEWWGHREDMPAVFRESTIVCLPSQGGEGVPKALLEAAASGRAMVTTDVPGCRDVVRQGVSGKLVSPGNPGVLADAIEELLNDQMMRKRMAEKAREIAVNRFSEEQVVAETLRLYRSLLNSASQPLAAVQSTTYETS